MQTRKKFVVKNAARQPASSRFCRNPKRMTIVAENKVSHIITSAKKQKNVGIFVKKKGDPEAAKNLNTTYLLEQVDNQNICTAYGPSLDHKLSGERVSRCVEDTIFSPAFHISKDAHVGISDEVDFMGFFGSKDESDHQDHGTVESKSDNLNCRVTCKKQKTSYDDRNIEPSPFLCDLNVITTEESGVQNNNGGLSLTETNSAYEEEHNVVGNLSSEVSAIYLAMQHSKLECIDEASQDSIISKEDCVEGDETDELDDFDPFMFIRNLPDLSTVVPTFRPMLLPKQTRSCPSTTLVLDLDETLVHSTLEPCEDVDFTFPVNFNLKEHLVYVRCRPYLKDFIERVSSLFEIIIFTASQSIYAEQLLNILDPKRRFFRHRVYRESCVFVEGNYLKDLSILGRDLARVIIIDNSPQVFGFQVDNGIPIESWFEDRSDQALPSLLPFLESLVGVKDVRPLISNKFNLREKIASAACSAI